MHGGAAASCRRPVLERIARPPPDVAEQVQQAIAVGRERTDRRRAPALVEEQVLPGNSPCQVLAIGRPPGTARRPRGTCARSRTPRAAYSHSASVGRRLAHPGRRMPLHPHRRPASRGAARACRCRCPGPSGRDQHAPATYAHQLVEVPKVDGTGGIAEHERARHRSAGSAPELLDPAVAGDGDAARGLARTAELRHGHAAVVGPEARHLDQTNGTLLRIEALRAHQKRPARDPLHAFAGRRGGE